MKSGIQAFCFRFLFGLLIVAVVIVAGFLAYGLLLPTGPDTQKHVQLKPGSSARRIASDLANAGIIRNQTAFLAWHYFRGRPTLKAGEYSFDHPANARAVYDRIARGDIYFHALVVPEGFNMFDIASAVDAPRLRKRDEFLKVVRTDTALARDPHPSPRTL